MLWAQRLAPLVLALVLEFAVRAAEENAKPIGAREAVVATRAGGAKIPLLANNLLRYTVFDITDSVDR